MRSVGCTSGVHMRASLKIDPEGSHIISGLEDGFVI